MTTHSAVRSTVEEWFGNDSLYIAELFVDERCRGKGMGSMLTAASLYLAAAMGDTPCSHLCVGEKHQSAARIYTEAFGFRRAKEGAAGIMTDFELADSRASVRAFVKRLEAAE